MVWVIEWNYPSDGESNVTVWDSEKAAAKQACSEIQDRIQSEWDMADYDMASEARQINDYVSAGQYLKAVKYWNNCSTNCDSDYAMFWHVREEQTRDLSDAGDPQIFDPDYFTALLDEEEEGDGDEDFDDASDSELEEEYTASVPGATCRGPCGQSNEYAYANKRDGTYVCHSCRMMSQVFGGTIK
jgi:hypothetical protein